MPHARPGPMPAAGAQRHGEKDGRGRERPQAGGYWVLGMGTIGRLHSTGFSNFAGQAGRPSHTTWLASPHRSRRYILQHSIMIDEDRKPGRRRQSPDSCTHPGPARKPRGATRRTRRRPDHKELSS